MEEDVFEDLVPFPDDKNTNVEGLW